MLLLKKQKAWFTFRSLMTMNGVILGLIILMIVL